MSVALPHATALAVSTADNTFNLEAVQEALVAVDAQEAQQSEALVVEAMKAHALSQQALESQLVEGAELALTSQQQCAAISQDIALAEADKKRLAAIVEIHERTIAHLQAELQAALAEIAKGDAAEALRVKKLQPVQQTFDDARSWFESTRR